MFKINFYIKSLIIVFTVFINVHVYASSGVTINELKQSISMLQEKHKKINITNPDLSSISDLKSFLKDDLDEVQIGEINKIIKEYNTFKINNSKSESYDTELLAIKKETYKKITIYVKSEKLDEYLEYIKNNLETIKQDKDIKVEISKKQEVLEAKVDAIKEKIKINKDEFNDNIQDLIEAKIEEKIKIIKENKDFQKLDLEKKKYVIEQIIKKVEIKKTEKEKITKQVTEKEFDVYDIVIEKLSTFLKELK